jgi:hypothetical protein
MGPDRIELVHFYLLALGNTLAGKLLLIGSVANIIIAHEQPNTGSLFRSARLPGMGSSIGSAADHG